MPETAIIILHYIKEELTRQCIETIKANTPAGSFHIYVVDNDSPEPLKLWEPFTTIIRNDSRFSTSGMNRGFHYALYESGITHNYVVNMDNDVICHKGWLEPLIKEMEEHPTTGICGGKQWNKDQSGYFSVGSDLSGWIHRNWPTERTEVTWIQGSFTMYRADMMRRIGLQDARFQDICSDSDYCIHALDRGWDVVFVPESNVTHLGGQSYKDYPTDHSQDFGQLLAKWFGTKFNSLANILPINSQERLYGQVNYKEIRR